MKSELEPCKKEYPSVVKPAVGCFIANEDGATAIEYALILLLVAVVIVAALGTLGVDLTTGFTGVSSGLGEASSAPPDTSGPQRPNNRVPVR